jgi:hypothetical protein
MHPRLFSLDDARKGNEMPTCPHCKRWFRPVAPYEETNSIKLDSPHILPPWLSPDPYDGVPADTRDHFPDPGEMVLGREGVNE